VNLRRAQSRDPKRQTRVLVIDDNDDFRKLAVLWLQSSQFAAEGASNGEEALELQRRNPADIIVTDMFMPRLDGVETIQQLRKEFPRVKVIAITGRSSMSGYEALRAAADLGATKVFLKPFALDELINAVNEMSAGPKAA
jgi:CheY-like chemotaxis protein